MNVEKTVRQGREEGKLKQLIITRWHDIHRFINDKQGISYKHLTFVTKDFMSKF